MSMNKNAALRAELARERDWRKSAEKEATRLGRERNEARAEVERLRCVLADEVAAHGHDLKSMERAEAALRRQDLTLIMKRSFRDAIRVDQS